MAILTTIPALASVESPELVGGASPSSTLMYVSGVSRASVGLDGVVLLVDGKGGVSAIVPGWSIGAVVMVLIVDGKSEVIDGRCVSEDISLETVFAILTVLPAIIDVVRSVSLWWQPNLKDPEMLACCPFLMKFRDGILILPTPVSQQSFGAPATQYM